MGTIIDNIFLIDDEDDSHFVTKLVLRKAGFKGQLFCFASAKEGFEGLKNATALPEVLLVDINMPETGGFEFLSACERNGLLPNGHTTVLMFSSSNRPQDIEAAQRFASVDGYVEKTLTVERYEQLVAQRRLRAPQP